MHPREIVKRGYDKIASSYEATRRGDSEDIQLLRLITGRLPKRAMVLDAGCGSGYPVTRFLAEFLEVTGVDFAEEQIRLARERVPDAEFIRADITSLPFQDSAFDAVCSYYAIIHVPRSEHQKLLVNFHRILRQGGLALLCMGAGDLPNEIADCHSVRMFWSHYDSDTNLRMMKENGFDILWFKTIADPIDRVRSPSLCSDRRASPHSADGP